MYLTRTQEIPTICEWVCTYVCFEQTKPLPLLHLFCDIATQISVYFDDNFMFSKAVHDINTTVKGKLKYFSGALLNKNLNC